MEKFINTHALINTIKNLHLHECDNDGLTASDIYVPLDEVIYVIEAYPMLTKSDGNASN